MPSAKVVVKGILPFVPPQVVGLTAEPKVNVAVLGSVRFLDPEAELVQLLTVMENPEYDPARRPDNVNAPEATVMEAVLAAPSL